MACADENISNANQLLPVIESSLTEVFAAYQKLSTDMVDLKN